MTHARKSELAERVATYLRGSLAIGQTKLTEVEVDGSQASFTATALDGKSVRVTIEEAS